MTIIEESSVAFNLSILTPKEADCKQTSLMFDSQFAILDTLSEEFIYKNYKAVHLDAKPSNDFDTKTLRTFYDLKCRSI